MKQRALTFALLLSCSAWAGEIKYLGRLTSTGASVNNSTTAVPFAIPVMAKLTLYCDAAARILHESETTSLAGADMGVPLPATTLCSSSSGGRNTIRISGVLSAFLAMIPVTGTVNCDVWLRTGTE